MTIELYQFQLEDVEHIARQKAGLIGSEMGTLDLKWVSYIIEI